jgi:hypothetical protein
MNLPRTDLVRYLVRHPSVAPTVLRAGWRLRRCAWWRFPPFLPIATREYWEFRVVTATGDLRETPRADEIVQAARWSMGQPVGR